MCLGIDCNFLTVFVLDGVACLHGCQWWMYLLLDQQQT